MSFAETEARIRAYYGLSKPFVLAPPAPVPPPPVPSVEPARAFLTEVNGRTLITGPADVPEIRQFALEERTNQYFLHLQGAFVGADEPNRNGACWTTADLELGEPTVRNGPLNWLHEDRHVIGALTDAKFVMPEPGLVEAAAAQRPFIAARSVVWRWLYGAEARVIERAAEIGHLWYSMECVSKEVECLTQGCGKVVPYMDTIRQAASVCEHVVAKNARRFVEPTFLGGAVILPPVRPGWADAHVELMQHAGVVAEAAYDQAGKPALEASTWEMLMAQVLQYAEPAA